MTLREARRDDIRRIIEMLADDEVARGREDLSGDMAAYHAAFDDIVADPNNTLYVWDENGTVMGCLQLTFIPGMSYGGSWIAKIEGVRVDRSLRGLGIGEQMIDAMVEKSRARGCKQLQLTTNKQRIEAQRFYKRIGFEASHEGMKLDL
jgi:ribosomal protein S18 acetylase RimI-like enzyme